MTTPTTPAERALLDAHSDAAVYCGMTDEGLLTRILAIKAEARAEAMSEWRATVNELPMKQARHVAKADAQLLALREALARIHEWHGDMPDQQPDALNGNLLCLCGRVLADTEAAAQEAREHIEAPWREALKHASVAYHGQAFQFSPANPDHRGPWARCPNRYCARDRALLDKGGEK